ncbi:electron transport complex subunit RsxG [Rouxiella badensis]|jgi:electron transport complex protein RnfG|uniref:Ion-translocating oxidoreductase complex subunit G n=2 Tax=Rouxiella badensis TaxID=1646377 RepID=A0A1X0WH80_9GAMM|nr:electron transport complex subunit RsxG [Rouxiella badensis]MCC3701941.1 electron transport complex subunit RsxG [Rouxiella badensis]MCC3718099.1 electron transport complex subunit RsxG [Rouxiella badensis]MCC3727133.1 electron transport complex subunit RsxG [Rouxiella badensis]MCC3731583.1 electron transport complex subunit RsxG [Rouxiella badensis]MCC3738518.1 electron transport complex subunit RsxG [Rouxiella badensis]
MLETMRRYGLTLAFFGVLMTGMTALVNLLTKPTIEHQALLQQKGLFDQVIPSSVYDNNMQQECYNVTSDSLGTETPHRMYLARKDGQPVAAVVETTAPDGYSGAIQLLVAADFHGKVYGTRVLEQHETPGLGDKIEVRISDWIKSFANQTVNGANDVRWAVKKDGGMFDQFTGATITPRAVVRSVKRTALFIETVPAQLSHLTPCGARDE